VHGVLLKGYVHSQVAKTTTVCRDLTLPTWAQTFEQEHSDLTAMQ